MKRDTAAHDGYVLVEFRYKHPAIGPFATREGAAAYLADMPDQRGWKVVPVDLPPGVRPPTDVNMGMWPGEGTQTPLDDMADDPDLMSVRRCGCPYDYHMWDCPVLRESSEPEGIFEPGDDDYEPDYDGDEEVR